MVSKKRNNQLSGHWADYLRPKRIDDLILPEARKKQIYSIIDPSQKPPNAILVTGETGAGKTTLARLIAAHLGGIADEYEKSPLSDRFVFPNDIIEINSGDQSGIENVRELITSVSYRPRQLKRRVVIMDEVHLLSRQAVSALLKPVEEPSSTTVWILCTNRPEKLREEIKRRCFNIELPYLTRKESVRLLLKIADRSGVSALFSGMDWGEEEKTKNTPAKEMFLYVASALVKKDINLARELVTSFQLLLKSIYATKPKTLTEAIDTLEELIKNTSFESSDFEGVDGFIDTVSHDPRKAVSTILDVANNPESFNELYYRVRHRIMKGSKDEYVNRLFTWCVDASGWSVHSGMRPLDYVAARLSEHLYK